MLTQLLSRLSRWRLHHYVNLARHLAPSPRFGLCKSVGNNDNVRDQGLKIAFHNRESGLLHSLLGIPRPGTNPAQHPILWHHHPPNTSSPFSILPRLIFDPAPFLSLLTPLFTKSFSPTSQLILLLKPQERKLQLHLSWILPRPLLFLASLDTTRLQGNRPGWGKCQRNCAQRMVLSEALGTCKEACEKEELM